jgi:hypothetical protein
MNSLEDALYELRELLDWKQTNVLNREVASLIHEIDRELKFLIQQYRIHQTLKEKKNKI